MNFEHYLGFITGFTMAFAALILGVLANRKRIKDLGLEPDERTELIASRASQWTLYSMLATTYVMWIVDNVMSHNAGNTITFFSPWGIMFFGSITVYLVAFGYSNYLSSQSILDGDSKLYYIKGAALVGSGLLMRRGVTLIPILNFVTIAAFMGGIFFISLALWKHKQEQNG